MASTRSLAIAPAEIAIRAIGVAPGFVSMASDDASYMTGQVLHPNGGTIVGGS